MAGNVWEWTRSLWGKDPEKPDFVYPYNPTDGREALDAPNDVWRVLRGGAFDFYDLSVRCSYRYWSNPYDWNYYIGFRVVASPSTSGL
jgi:formylglycine-generating enzyme required for sulfatase activity